MWAILIIACPFELKYLLINIKVLKTNLYRGASDIVLYCSIILLIIVICKRCSNSSFLFFIQEKSIEYFVFIDYLNDDDVQQFGPFVTVILSK